MKDVRILIGDAREQLRTLPDESVDCVVTSPPYWGLRDYSVDGQLGLEETLEEHIRVMVEEVFAEVHRVLKPSGTCFVNYGDCYATTANGRKAVDIVDDDRGFVDKPFSTIGGRIKAKDLCLMPARFAIAMQEFGWWCRSEIIWHKPSPMPESAVDRPHTAHEKIYLFTKSGNHSGFWLARDTWTISSDPDLSETRITHSGKQVPRWQKLDYYFNLQAVRQKAKPKTATTINCARKARLGQTGTKAANMAGTTIKMPDGWDSGEGGHGTIHRNGREKGKRVHIKSVEDRVVTPRNQGHKNHLSLVDVGIGSSNLKNVWTIASRPFREAHFATFPVELPELCIAAGCPTNGIVLDPFGGAGTTALAAKNLGRKSILIELNPGYAEIAAVRLRSEVCSVEGVDAQPVSNLPLLQAMEAAE